MTALVLKEQAQAIYSSMDAFFESESFEIEAFNSFLANDGALPWVKVSIGRSQLLKQTLTPAPYDPIAQLVPFEDSVEISLSGQLKAEKLKATIHYALGLIGLGKIRPSDTYSLWISEQDLQFRSGEGWAYQVKENYPQWFAEPRRKVESLEECTPKEKALLGLWHLIGEKIGTSRSLHPLAIEYQQAAYQRQAAERLLSQLEEYSGAMLCDDVGLGKTYIATTVMVHYANWWHEHCKQQGVPEHQDSFRITVLAPNSVVSTWQREAIPPLSAFGVPINHIRVFSHNKLSRITSSSSVLAREHNRLSDLEHLLASDLVIVDEAHNFRSTTAARTQVLRDFLRYQPRKEFLRKVLLLTATPINNSLDDLEQELSLMFSSQLQLSDKVTAEAYRREALEKIQRMCERAVEEKNNNKNLSSLILHGKASHKIPAKTDFRSGLDFGPQIADLKKYLKEQNKVLENLQIEVRNAANDVVPEVDANKERATISRSRVAGELLDRIVVQRSRQLCKAIERQQNSDVEILFRPDTGEPERLYYEDEFDETKGVLESFLPLFGEPGFQSGAENDEQSASDPASRPLSFKAYMWYDVRQALKSAGETSSVVGLQRALVLKRLESSPVAFLITLLRLLVLHARHLNELTALCRACQDSERLGALDTELALVQSLVSNKAKQQLLTLVTRASFDISSSDEGFISQLARQYTGEAASLDLDDDIPVQVRMEFDTQEGETTLESEQLCRLWELKDYLLQDFETLLHVGPQVASLVFSQFSISEWPRNFCEGKDTISWPRTESWARRLLTDAKVFELIKRLLLARRLGQKVIVFSQFTDSLAYVYSVCEALQALDEQSQVKLSKRFSSKAGIIVAREEFSDLLSVIDKVTGGTEERDDVVNRFAPYYRIGPMPPKVQANEFDEFATEEQADLLAEWQSSWRGAMHSPLDVLFASDVLAEGVNLQDAALLINWDVHWNPVKMIQRAGRIDRRLNPAIETLQIWPELQALAVQEGKPIPAYYWHTHTVEAPITVNMILPDELEEELKLRERIASKTLAIDFTLGLEQGTGAEADWMSNYKYQGVQSLNAFQKERAIETIATLYESIAIRFTEIGIRKDWFEDLDSWVIERGAEECAPLLALADMGLEDMVDGHKQYSRVLTPIKRNDHLCWMWTEQRSQDSALNHWLILDSETLPPDTSPVTEWQPQYSTAVSPEVLLILAHNVMDDATHFDERDVDHYGMSLMQGLSAISAGFFGSDQDREELEVNSFLIIQSSCLTEL